MPYKNKIIGIYQISFTTKEKVYLYIGHSINCQQRNKQHLDGLKFNKHDNPIMQNLYNKYGLEAYKFEVIEKITDVNLLVNREQHYIDLIPKNIKINIAHADRHIITKAIKNKISKTRKERIANGSISLEPACEARVLKKELIEKTTFYKLIHKETKKQIIDNVINLADYFDLPINKLKKYIREVLRPKSKCKTLYGYYIERIS